MKMQQVRIEKNSEILRQVVPDTIKKLKNGKSPGVENMKTEIYGEDLLHHIIQITQEMQEASKDWKTSVILPIYKKGRQKKCHNYKNFGDWAQKGYIKRYIELKVDL